MPITLTLKNIPDDVYHRLKRAAEQNRRSMNMEAIVCLDAALAPARVEASERVARARALRSTLDPARFRPSDIDAFKRRERP